MREMGLSSVADLPRRATAFASLGEAKQGLSHTHLK